MSEAKCPACGSEARKLWEAVGGINGGTWFTGLYACPDCWHFKATGTNRNGVRRVVQWHPACPHHGADPVMVTMAGSHDFATHDTEWTCSACGRKFAVVDGKITTIWKPYQPIFPEHPVNLVERVMQRIGGLPHD